jgi:hypothetical protein
MEKREIEALVSKILNDENLKLKRSMQKYTGKGLGG